MTTRVVVRETIVELWVERCTSTEDIDALLRELPAGKSVVIYRSGHMPLDVATEDLMVAQSAVYQKLKPM